MISYASIDSIEGSIAVCEVELIPFEESRPEDFKNKDTSMMDIELSKFPMNNGNVNEGDIFVVKHDNGSVECVLFKDEDEKQRRIEMLRKIFD